MKVSGCLNLLSCFSKSVSYSNTYVCAFYCVLKLYWVKICRSAPFCAEMSRITIMTRLKPPRARSRPGNGSVCAADKMADWHTDVFNFAQATKLLVLGRPLQGCSGPHSDQSPSGTPGTFCTAPESHQWHRLYRRAHKTWARTLFNNYRTGPRRWLRSWWARELICLEGERVIGRAHLPRTSAGTCPPPSRSCFQGSLRKFSVLAKISFFFFYPFILIFTFVFLSHKVKDKTKSCNVDLFVEQKKSVSIRSPWVCQTHLM